MHSQKSKPRRKPRLEIVFDPQKRIDFLTGFRKRKNERRKKAKEELEVLLKEEKKRIRQEVKDGVKNLKKSYAPLPEVEEFLNKKEYEDENVMVKVVEITTGDLARKKNWLGDNKAQSSEEDEADGSNPESDQEEVPGMGMVEKQPKKLRSPKEKKPEANTESTGKSKKEINRITAKTTTKFLKNSKIFKLKQNMDRIKNRKKARQEKNKNLKIKKKIERRDQFKKGKLSKRKHK